MDEQRLISRAMSVLSRRRKVKRGGRKLSGSPRCACGAMTAKRAEARKHVCTVQDRVAENNLKGSLDRSSDVVS